MMLGVHRSLSFCCYWGDILGGYPVHPLATLSSSHRMWPGGRGRCLKQISIAISMYYSLQQPFRAQKFRSTTILVWNSYLKVCSTFWVWDPHDFGGWVRVVKRRFWRELTSLFVEWNDLHLVVVPILCSSISKNYGSLKRMIWLYVRDGYIIKENISRG